MDTQLRSEDPPSLLPDELEGLGAFNFGTESHHLPVFSSVPKDKDLDGVQEDHHIRLSEHAASLWKNNRMTDVVVKLRHVEYPAHKTVLTCYSQYFKETLMETDPAPSVIHMKMDAVSNEAFSALLKYMYTGHLHVTVQTIGEIYTAARKLGMYEPISQCTQILTGKSRRNVHSVYVYVTAKRIGLEDAMRRALKNMCKRFEQIVGTQEFLDLSYNQVMEYLSSEKLATRSEVIVYLGALKWVSVDFLEREQFAADVVGCVRFPQMSLNEILACHNPPILPGIVELPQIKDMLLKATCFVAARTVNEEKRFQKYNCLERTYLIDREPIILWDPNIFDPERYAFYSQEVAASKIQATFRGHLVRRDMEREKEKAGENYLGSSPSNDSEEQEEDQEIEDGRRPVDKPLTERIRSSVNTLFNPGMKAAESTKKETAESTPKGKRVSIKKSCETQHVDEVTKRGVVQKKYFKKVQTVSVDETEETDSPQGSGGVTTKSVKGKRVRSDVRDQGMVVLTGGFFVNHVSHPKSGNMLLLYDPAWDRWNKLGEMPKPRHHHCTVHCNGVIYCIGGCDPRRTQIGDMRPLKTVFGLNLSSMMWKELSPMRHARMYHSAVELDGKIYVIGGQDEHERILNSLEVYDPKDDQWYVLTESLDMPIMGSGACAHQGRIWIIGGMGPDVEGKTKAVSAVKCFEPYKEEFTCDIPPLPYPRAFAAAVVFDNRMLVLGGTEHAIPENAKSDENLLSTSSVLIYDENQKTWNEFPELLSPRHFVSTLCQGTTLFAFGGLTSFERVALKDALRFSIDIEEWVKCKPIPYPLCGFSSVWIPKIKD